jgi:hypothetical protein
MTSAAKHKDEDKSVAKPLAAASSAAANGGALLTTGTTNDDVDRRLATSSVNDPDAVNLLDGERST